MLQLCKICSLTVTNSTDILMTAFLIASVLLKSIVAVISIISALTSFTALDTSIVVLWTIWLKQYKLEKQFEKQEVYSEFRSDCVTEQISHLIFLFTH